MRSQLRLVCLKYSVCCTGMNAFLKNLDITFRRDPTNYRPRINKADSTKDQEQKSAGTYYVRVFTHIHTEHTDTRHILMAYADTEHTDAHNILMAYTDCMNLSDSETVMPYPFYL